MVIAPQDIDWNIPKYNERKEKEKKKWRVQGHRRISLSRGEINRAA